MRFWGEANGPNLAMDWVSALPSKLDSLAKKVLLEPVIRTQLAILQFVVTHDLETRIKLSLNPASLYSFLLSRFF